VLPFEPSLVHDAEECSPLLPFPNRKLLTFVKVAFVHQSHTGVSKCPPGEPSFKVFCFEIFGVKRVIEYGQGINGAGIESFSMCRIAFIHSTHFSVLWS
jgi:hypothetical protein